MFHHLRRQCFHWGIDYPPFCLRLARLLAVRRRVVGKSVRFCGGSPVKLWCKILHLGGVKHKRIANMHIMYVLTSIIGYYITFSVFLVILNTTSSSWSLLKCKAHFTNCIWFTRHFPKRMQFGLERSKNAYSWRVLNFYITVSANDRLDVLLPMMRQ